mmetsp:Transcript_41572/g.120362  ORF Transcript_41572/g.120362 Transcript_41572/m.120362 type:complete len:709 (-) Transcript_41572:117-2243(-)
MAPRAAAAAAGLLLLLVAPANAARASMAVRGSGARAVRGTTPVKKVIELLKQLSAKVEDDGKKEAAAYDKYACFCKEQADQKLYAIEKSESIMSELSAESSQLQTEISDLSTGISGLASTISNLEGEIKNATDVRSTDNGVYLGREADTSGAISALKRAITSIKESKGQMGGKVALEAALLQVRAAAARTAVGHTQQKLLAAMAKGSQPGEAYDYEFHSNDILATLNSLLMTFKETKERLDLEEFQAQSEFEKRKLGLENEKTFAEKEKLGKEKLEAMKTERRQAAQAELLAETGARDADQAFMRELTTQCEDKATEWDTRSQTRSQELTAISQALEALETGVAPNWKANRMLVGLQKAKQQAPSFLQLRGSGHNLRASGARALQQKVLALIGDAANRLHSPALSVVALRVKASEDHFEKVRAIIKDIVARLEAQASAEASTKTFCDGEMSAAVSSRDAKAEEVENLEGQITEKEATKAQLLGEIAALAKGIAENTKALQEATELRSEEQRDNNGVMRDATAGKEAVEYALQVLKAFYESQGSTLLQGHESYVPPNSDRAGQTVGDLAPEVFGSGYGGQQEASKGVIGMLEVILSDFDRTNGTVASQEQMAEGDFQTFKGAIDGDTSSKEGDKTTKEGEVSTIENDLVTLTDSKRDAVRDKELAESELEGLRSMCVEGEETYEERVAKREKEIAALKEAHAILENWQG